MAKRNNRPKIGPFSPSDYLDNEGVIAEYLSAALEDPNSDVFVHAVADVAEACGISNVTKVLSPAQRRELDRRLDAYELDKSQGRLAADVLNDLRRRLSTKDP